jgi:hypothetical protein
LQRTQTGGEFAELCERKREWTDLRRKAVVCALVCGEVDTVPLLWIARVVDAVVDDGLVMIARIERSREVRE